MIRNTSMTAQWFVRYGRKHPFDPEEIGNRDSLFCWTLRQWPLDGADQGWMVCDDGAMELADFIQVHDKTITLIHAWSSRQPCTADFPHVVVADVS
jgi:hypothetical protein